MLKKKKQISQPNADDAETYFYTPHMCPVCGKYEFGDMDSYDICPFCGWEDDGEQLDDPDFAGGVNHMSLNDYKKEYSKK